MSFIYNTWREGDRVVSHNDLSYGKIGVITNLTYVIGATLATVKFKDGKMTMLNVSYLGVLRPSLHGNLDYVRRIL